MRITRDNVEAVKDLARQIADLADDIESSGDQWLDEDEDEETRAEARNDLEASLEELDGACRSIVELSDRWAFYETATSKKLKARIAELEKELENAGR